MRAERFGSAVAYVGLAIACAIIIFGIWLFVPRPRPAIESNGTRIPLCDPDTRPSTAPTCPPDGSQNDVPGDEPAGAFPIFSSPAASGG